MPRNFFGWRPGPRNVRAQLRASARRIGGSPDDTRRWHGPTKEGEPSLRAVPVGRNGMGSERERSRFDPTERERLRPSRRCAGVSSDAKDEPKRGARSVGEERAIRSPATHADARAGCPIRTARAGCPRPLKEGGSDRERASAKLSRERWSKSPAARWRRSTSDSERSRSPSHSGRPEAPTGNHAPSSRTSTRTIDSLPDEAVARAWRQPPPPLRPDRARRPAKPAG